MNRRSTILLFAALIIASILANFTWHKLQGEQHEMNLPIVNVGSQQVVKEEVPETADMFNSSKFQRTSQPLRNVRKAYRALDTPSSVCPKRISMKDIKRDEIPVELYRLAPSTFDDVPSKFLEGLRSPCWRRAGDNTMICLPSFFLAGVGKCGTTDVWDKIVKHSQIIGGFKEPRWWGRKQFGRGTPSNKPVPLLKYANYFKSLAELVSQNDEAAKHLISGDGSPSVYWDNAIWRKSLTKACSNATTPLYVIPDVIRALLPRSKVIAVFRHPADRLYSDYLFENETCTREYFHEVVAKSTRTFDSCLASSSRRECVFKFFSHVYDHQTRRIGRNPMMKLFKGMYSVFVTDWLNAFPRDQLMFIRMEDWHSNCEDMLPDIYKFLELSPLSRKIINHICSEKQKNPTRGKKKKGPMLKETRTILNEFYKPTLQDLAEILEGDHFLWAD